MFHLLCCNMRDGCDGVLLFVHSASLVNFALPLEATSFVRWSHRTAILKALHILVHAESLVVLTPHQILAM